MTEDNSQISPLMQKVLKEKDNLVVPRRSDIPEGRIPSLLEKIQTEFKLADVDEAKIVVAVFFQQGGTARSCDGNMTINLFDKEFKLAKLRKIIKDSGFVKGERKLARSIATDIYNICKGFNLPGNLYQKIKRQHPEREFSASEQIWLSDFQSLNNDAPSGLRSLIIESFKKPVTPPAKRRTGK